MSNLTRLEKLLNMLSSEVVMERATAGAQIAHMARSQGMLVAEFMQKTYAGALTKPPPPPPNFNSAQKSRTLFHCKIVTRLASYVQNCDLMDSPLTEWEIDFVSSVLKRNPKTVSEKQEAVIHRIIEKLQDDL